MSDLKNWYLGGMVVAADKAEFKEDEHPRGKGGMFVKKGEGGGGSSALEEVYKKGGFKHPEALAKADLEELGKMDDSRLDAEITMLKGKVEEGGKPLDKARLEAAEGIMNGRGGKKGEGGDKSVDTPKLSKEQEREVNHLLKMDNEEFDDVYDYTKSWIDEARSGSVKLANGRKMEVPNWMLKRQEDFLGLLEVAKAKRGVKVARKTNSELHDLLVNDSDKFDELESSVMREVGKNIKESTSAQKSGDSELAKQKMKIAQDGQKETERFARIRELHALESAAEKFHSEGNDYMEKAYKKFAKDYRAELDKDFGEV